MALINFLQSSIQTGLILALSIISSSIAFYFLYHICILLSAPLGAFLVGFTTSPSQSQAAHNLGMLASLYLLLGTLVAEFSSFLDRTMNGGESFGVRLGAEMLGRAVVETLVAVGALSAAVKLFGLDRR